MKNQGRACFLPLAAGRYVVRSKGTNIVVVTVVVVGRVVSFTLCFGLTEVLSAARGAAVVEVFSILRSLSGTSASAASGAASAVVAGWWCVAVVAGAAVVSGAVVVVSLSLKPVSRRSTLCSMPSTKNVSGRLGHSSLRRHLPSAGLYTPHWHLWLGVPTHLSTHSFMVSMGGWAAATSSMFAAGQPEMGRLPGGRAGTKAWLMVLSPLQSQRMMPLPLPVSPWLTSRHFDLSWLQWIRPDSDISKVW
mmetsp:Transcript_48365/g.127701  ORF Transcript_48365/g.127701 Transcript_48365/m.127701 type:complete len:248 (-) Transcript_48365:426-1169(-)